MKERPRTDNKARYATQYTDDDFINAVQEALNNATVSAADVAEILGCNPRYATNRLKELVEENKIAGVMKGKAWGFRLLK